MPKFLFKNGRVWDGEKFENKNVYVEDGKIAYIGKDEVKTDYEFDISGKILSPGLVDIHTHMRNVSGNNFGYEAHLLSIPFGVTCAADCSGNNGSDEVMDLFTIKPVVFAGARIVDNEADFETLEKNMSRYNKYLTGIKVYFDKGVHSVTDQKPLEALAEYANEKGLKMMVHCANSPVSMKEYLPVFNPGDILTHAFHGGDNTCADDNFESIREAQQRGVIIDAGMAGCVHTDFKIFETAIKNNIIPDVISTDITKNSAYIRGGVYGLTMCMSIAKDLGMSEEDVFRCVTSNAAKAVGKEDEWGKLEVGRCADLCVIDCMGAPYDTTDKAGYRITSHKSYRCYMTMIDGYVMYRVNGI